MFGDNKQAPNFKPLLISPYDLRQQENPTEGRKGVYPRPQLHYNTNFRLCQQFNKERRKRIIDFKSKNCQRCGNKHRND